MTWRDYALAGVGFALAFALFWFAAVTSIGRPVSALDVLVPVAVGVIAVAAIAAIAASRLSPEAREAGASDSVSTVSEGKP